MHALEFSRQVPERGRVSVYGAPDENILLMATTGKSPVLLGIYVVDNDISHTHISLIGRDQTERDMVFAIARKYCPKSANDHWFDSLNGEYVIP